MIKKLHLYIIREFFGCFIFGMAVFSILLVLNFVFDLVDLFLSKGVTFFLVLKLFAFYILNILTLSIPMAVLFGVLVAYGRLSADNEITAMKSSGLSYYTLTIPVIVLIFIISFFLLFFNHFLAPAINTHFKSFFEEVIMKKPLIKFNAKSVIDLGEYRLYANKVNNKDNTLLGVSIYKFENKDDKDTWRIAASSGIVKVCENGVQFTLHNGYWQKAHSASIKNMIHMTFKNYVFFIPINKVIKEHNLTAPEITSPALLKIIERSKKENLPIILYECNFWGRWTFAFAPLAFVLVALPIAIMAGKNGKGIGFVMSLAIILVYYTLFILARNLAENGYAPIRIIVWLPNFLITTVGICLFIKMRKK
ncbi:MAG: LptF/LptG family permease [Endomicrobium sp.]|nr:LptF/LptG family permease [Endomicrobium sp.]